MKKCGLIGEKLGHSFSKTIHQRINNDYTYELFPVEKSEFENFIMQKDFHALNVTIPYKIRVIPYLQKLDDRALEIGAVNTVLNQNGELYGYNTDFGGFLYLLQQHNIQVAGKKVIVIGNGGASKAVLAVLKHENAKEVLILYHKDNPKNSPSIISYEECMSRHQDCQMIVNTTPVGMFPHIGESPLPLDSFYNLEAVVDVIYNPISSDLVVQAKKRGILAVGGLEMLLAQAREGAEIFTGKAIEADMVDRLYREMLSEQLNIILVGMPSSGKTTIGKLLSQSLGRQFFDSDDEIIKEINMPIADYFVKFGETAFRQIESDIIKELSGKTGVVISTGGGCILNSRNMDYLKQNGIILFINRDISHLLVSNDRPLSNSREALSEMFEKRLPLYQVNSAAIIENNDSLEGASQLALEAFKLAVANY